MANDTVGKLSSDLIVKSQDNNHSAHEQMQEQLGEYEKNFYECLERSKLDFSGSFYIVVITKKERLMQNVIRNYFFGRGTCPTPDWDQTVYVYNRKEDAIHFLWVIPSKDTCEYMTAFPMDIPAEERQLLRFVHDFNDGTLLRYAKTLNGEELLSPLLIN